MSVKICARARGPLVIETDQPIELIGPDGKVLEVEPGSKLFLCRCGASRSRPRCDGSHNRIGFEAPDPAADDGAS